MSDDGYETKFTVTVDNSSIYSLLLFFLVVILLIMFTGKVFCLTTLKDYVPKTVIIEGKEYIEKESYDYVFNKGIKYEHFLLGIQNNDPFIYVPNFSLTFDSDFNTFVKVTGESVIRITIKDSVTGEVYFQKSKEIDVKNFIDIAVTSYKCPACEVYELPKFNFGFYGLTSFDSKLGTLNDWFHPAVGFGGFFRYYFWQLCFLEGAVEYKYSYLDKLNNLMPDFKFGVNF